MQHTAPILAALLVALSAMQDTDAASISNCAGAEISIDLYRQDSAHRAAAIVLEDQASTELPNLEADTVVKLFELSLFDVLRISRTGLMSDATYVVTADSRMHWRLRRGERC